MSARLLRGLALATLLGVTALLAGCPPCYVNLATLRKAQAMLNKGVGFVVKNQLEKGQQACEMALTYHKCFAEAYNCLGMIAMRKGKNQLAVKHFKKALRQNSNFVEARSNLGNVAFARRQYAKAEQWYMSALKLVPCHFGARYNRTLALVQLRRWTAARKNSVRLSLCPGKSHKTISDFLLANIEHNRKDYKLSFIGSQKVIQASPTYAPAHLLKCKAAYQLKKFCVALMACRRAVFLRPQHIPSKRALQTVAQTLKKNGIKCP